MHFIVKKYYLVLLLVFMAVVSACSVDNKSIPDPDGNIGVDTTGTIGTFYLNVTGDTSYLLTIVAVDTIKDDTFGVAGADVTSRDEIVFAAYHSAAGTYYTEQSPPGITSATFLFRKKVATGYKNYAMLHGQIIISSIDLTTGVVRGSVDVNNQYVVAADKLYRLKGNFVMKANL